VKILPIVPNAVDFGWSYHISKVIKKDMPPMTVFGHYEFLRSLLAVIIKNDERMTSYENIRVYRREITLMHKLEMVGRNFASYKFKVNEVITIEQFVKISFQYDQHI